MKCLLIYAAQILFASVLLIISSICSQQNHPTIYRPSCFIQVVDYLRQNLSHPIISATLLFQSPLKSPAKIPLIAFSYLAPNSRSFFLIMLLSFSPLPCYFLLPGLSLIISSQLFFMFSSRKYVKSLLLLYPSTIQISAIFLIPRIAFRSKIRREQFF